MSWELMLEFLSTYYSTLHGSLKKMFYHNAMLDPFEDLDDIDDKDDDDINMNVS
jgi:hypothetical protein